MPRYFSECSKQELASKIIEAFKKYNENDYNNLLCDYDYKESKISPINIIGGEGGYGIPWRDLTPQIEKDMKKCEFDMENVTTKGWGNDFKNIMGFQSLKIGNFRIYFTYLGVMAGGDWEEPVYFIIYWDGAKLRAYIPNDGNPWNEINKMPFGNDENSDIDYLVHKKIIPPSPPSIDISDIVNELRSEDKIIAEIIKHFEYKKKPLQENNTRIITKIPKIQKDRKLQSGRVVAQYDKEISMTISSQCPDKWLFVDMETGDVWHRKEDEFKQIPSIPFWRGASKKEMKELKKLLGV